MSFQHLWLPVPGATKTLLLLHGTGGDEKSLIPLGQSVAPDYSLLSVRGNVSENGMPRFFRRFAEGVLDEDDIRKQAADLASFLRLFAVENGFSLDTLYALGFSNGANMASSLLMLQPDVLTGFVGIRTMVPLRPDPMPFLAGKSALVLVGRNDSMMPEGHCDELASMLRQAGGNVDLVWVDAGHELTRTDVDAAKKWLGSRE